MVVRSHGSCVVLYQRIILAVLQSSILWKYRLAISLLVTRWLLYGARETGCDNVLSTRLTFRVASWGDRGMTNGSPKEGKQGFGQLAGMVVAKVPEGG